MTILNTGYSPLGEALKGTDSEGNLINSDKLGLVVEFKTFSQDVRRRGSPTRPSQGISIYAVLLRNTSGGVLLPKRMALLSATAGYKPLQEAINYASSRGERNCVLVDPWLPSAGVAANDLFWGIIGGPAIVLTPIAGSAFAGDIAVGNHLVATTGTTTGATTSGRLGNVTIANATDAQGAYDAMSSVGRALSARTTGETNADLLVYFNNRAFNR